MVAAPRWVGPSEVAREVATSVGASAETLLMLRLSVVRRYCCTSAAPGRRRMSRGSKPCGSGSGRGRVAGRAARALAPRGGGGGGGGGSTAAGKPSSHLQRGSPDMIIRDSHACSRACTELQQLGTSCCAEGRPPHLLPCQQPEHDDGGQPLGERGRVAGALHAPAQPKDEAQVQAHQRYEVGQGAHQRRALRGTAWRGGRVDGGDAGRWADAAGAARCSPARLSAAALGAGASTLPPGSAGRAPPPTSPRRTAGCSSACA